MEYTVALAGNPNAGKSTLFNALTGGRQHVGNWPGKTVSRAEGVCALGGHTVHIVDLPGTYSLTAYSSEEAITRDYVIHEQPDAVIAVVDAGNLERNLYLVVQLLELGARLMVVLNMADMAEARGLVVQPDKLAARLGVPVVLTSAVGGRGLSELKEMMVGFLQGSQARGRQSTSQKGTNDVHCPKCY